MIGTVRRIHLLTALALLLSGLLQPLAAAQGVTCTRTHAPAQEAGHVVDGSASESEGSRVVPTPHQHDSIPQPDAAGAPSAPCGVASIPSEQRLFSPAVQARQLLPAGDLPPASLLIQSLFRPPRLS